MIGYEGLLWVSPTQPSVEVSGQLDVPLTRNFDGSVAWYIFETAEVEMYQSPNITERTLDCFKLGVR